MQARPGDAEQQQPVAGLSDEVHLLGGERTQQHLEQGWGDLGERAVQAERLVCLQRRDPAVLGDERQQLLSLIAQHGGITPLQAHETLCLHGPFAQVSPTLFKMLLRALAAEKVDLITQASDGLLLLGVAGERLVNHYSFYAAFRTADEYRLIANGRPLGTLPIDYPLMPGSLLIFAGRRWKVLAVDAQAKVVELIRSSGGRPPLFTGSGGEVADRVRQEMRTIYTTTDVPAYLDATAVRLLAEGRANFTRFGLGEDPLLTSGVDTLIFAWRGDRILSTLAVALTGAGID